VANGPEQHLITDQWCQQFPSHSIGHLAFGPDGMLYVTGGDGASFTNTDWGQFGGGAGSPTPANPCGDPPSPVGTALSPPSAEGGALRSQSPRRVAGHPILLDGAVLRVDPATGNGVAGNPMYNPQNPSSNASRIIGYGLRNPFRFTFRPGTPELWVGDVGWNTWEEVNRMTSPTPTSAVNFGWPCYEGAGRMSSYDSANLTICETSTPPAARSAPTTPTTTRRRWSPATPARPPRAR
jgi:glucose/arabinose dehydrogenase